MLLLQPAAVYSFPSVGTSASHRQGVYGEGTMAQLGSESETTRLKLDTCWWSMEKVP